ncbi:helix-turn-helix transcriptional regulator [Runella sp.]|uniref:helix-turn-helix transcriptional regulator n=1 Tax=Runella sp. TaxID=1960881 RepID=UPI003019923E
MRLVDKLKKNFAQNLQMLRTRNKLTQAGLADELNDRYQNFDFDIQRTSIVNYEAESAMPRIDALYCIADYFGKTIDQIISPNMDAATLVHRWMNPAGPEPNMRVASERYESSKHEQMNSGAPASYEAYLNGILTGYVDALAYRQFYVEFLKRFMFELQKDARNLEEREKINGIFDKTFLGCWISKSKYFQDLAANLLDEVELKVFLAFQENSSLEMIAKGLEMDEQQVVEIFANAQLKINTLNAGPTKS